MRKHLLIIGAGPVGLAAAHGALRRGLEVTVLEQGAGVGESMRRWGATRFFSPLAMNLPPGANSDLPRDSILTGPEFVDTVLAPYAELLEDRIQLRHRVVSVGRTGLTRGDFAGHPIRAERNFRVLVETPDGERFLEADAVIDASGTYGQPVPLGYGGLPARGERAVAGQLFRHLDRLYALEGKTVLLAGHGHSAANALIALEGKAEVIWATRSMHRKPCVDVASDPLPERQRIVAQANQFAMQPPSWLRVERRAMVESIAPVAGRWDIQLTGGRSVIVDAILGLTGYRPDLAFLSELAIAIDPATEGAAGLARALSNVTDCLSLPKVRPEDLDSGEPGFFLAGAKSYGRARTFLLQSGYAQVETILDRLQNGG